MDTQQNGDTSPSSTESREEVGNGNIMTPSRLSSEEQHSCAMIEEVLSYMTNVEKGMASLREYVTTYNAEKRPLLQWPKYECFDKLVRAAFDLDQAVDALELQAKKIRIPRRITTHYVSQARDLSISTSNATVYVMKIMSIQTSKYANELESESLGTGDKDLSKSVVMREVSKLLKYSTEATNSIWSATDLLQQLHNINLKIKSERNEQKLGVRGWLTLIFILLSFLWIIAHEYEHPIILAGFRYRNPDYFELAFKTTKLAEHTDNILHDMNNIYTLFHKTIKLTSDLQQAKINDLNNRYKAMESALEDNGIRIDNLWEALGPPNINGTYYGYRDTFNSKGDEDGKLEELKESLQSGLKKVDINVMGLRKSMQMMDVRLSKRLDKVERKGG